MFLILVFEFNKQAILCLPPPYKLITDDPQPWHSWFGPCTSPSTSLSGSWRTSKEGHPIHEPAQISQLEAMNTYQLYPLDIVLERMLRHETTQVRPISLIRLSYLTVDAGGGLVPFLILKPVHTFHAAWKKIRRADCTVLLLQFLDITMIVLKLVIVPHKEPRQVPATVSTKFRGILLGQGNLQQPLEPTLLMYEK